MLGLGVEDLQGIDDAGKGVLGETAAGRAGGKKKVKWVLFEARVPLRLGKALPLIPFVFQCPKHSLPDVDRMPLNDLMVLNLDHYRLDADFKHGLHYTALPTAWVSGFDKSATLRIGSSTAWVSETPGAYARLKSLPM